jgi:hypothetical protein
MTAKGKMRPLDSSRKIDVSVIKVTTAPAKPPSRFDPPLRPPPLPIDVSASTVPGEYVISYVCAAPGLHVLDVKVGGKNISGSPFRVIAESLGPDARLCDVVGDGLEKAMQREGATLTIVSKDKFGNALEEGGADFQVLVMGGPDDKLERVKAVVTDQGNGQYTATYCCEGHGTYEIIVRHNGQNVKGSPYSLLVLPEPVDPESCRVSGAALAGGREGDETSIDLALRTSSQALLDLPDSQLSVSVTRTVDGFQVPVAIGHVELGRYRARFTPEGSGRYRIDASVQGSVVCGCPLWCVFEPGWREWLLALEADAGVELAETVSPQQGLKVLGLKKNGAAHRGGIRVGDFIRSIGEILPQSRVQWESVLLEQTAGDLTTWSILDGNSVRGTDHRYGPFSNAVPHVAMPAALIKLCAYAVLCACSRSWQFRTVQVVLGARKCSDQALQTIRRRAGECVCRHGYSCPTFCNGSCATFCNGACGARRPGMVLLCMPPSTLAFARLRRSGAERVLRAGAAADTPWDRALALSRRPWLDLPAMRASHVRHSY